MARGLRIGYARQYRVWGEAGAYTNAGQNAGLNRGRTLTAEQGSFTVTGRDATLTYAESGGGDLTHELVTLLTWNADPSATGYRIYRGTTSGVHTNNWDVGNVTEYDVNLLTPKMAFGTTYYFAIASLVGTTAGTKSSQIQVRNWVLL